MTEIERIAREMVRAWSTLNDVSNFLRQADDKDLLIKQKALYVRSKSFEYAAKLEMDLSEAVLNSDKRTRLLGTKVADLDLTTRTRYRLAENNIITVADLAQKTEVELLKSRVSKRSVKEIKDYLDETGLHLRMEG